MKKVAIIILNYNGARDTLECVASITSMNHKNIEIQIIVVDNASIEKDILLLKSLKNKIKLIENNENLGFSGGNNVGIDYAIDLGVEYILLLNNDTLVEPNMLQELLRVFESRSEVGIAVPKIYFAKGHEFHTNKYSEKERGKVIWYAGGIMDWNNVLAYHRGVDEVDHGQFESVSKTDFATGCCLLIKKEVIKHVGMFDENYFLYYEDNDLSERVKRDGYSIVFNPKAIVWHKNAQSAGGSGSDLQDYYISRNRLLFGYRYAPLRSKIALLRESIQVFFNGRKWQRKGIVDYYIGKMGKGSFTF